MLMFIHLGPLCVCYGSCMFDEVCLMSGRFYHLKTIMIVSMGGIVHSADPYKCRGLLTCIPSTKYAHGYRQVNTGTLTKTGLLVINCYGLNICVYVYVLGDIVD